MPNHRPQYPISKHIEALLTFAMTGSMYQASKKLDIAYNTVCSWRKMGDWDTFISSELDSASEDALVNGTWISEPKAIRHIRQSFSIRNYRIAT